jgi:hypothetical protein
LAESGDSMDWWRLTPSTIEQQRTNGIGRLRMFKWLLGT